MRPCGYFSRRECQCQSFRNTLKHLTKNYVTILFAKLIFLIRVPDTQAVCHTENETNTQRNKYTLKQIHKEKNTQIHKDKETHIKIHTKTRQIHKHTYIHIQNDTDTHTETRTQNNTQHLQQITQENPKLQNHAKNDTNE